MRLHVIRHGMTEANEKRLYCSYTDLPLSEEGRSGLGLLKKTIVYPSADMYIISGLTRACATLQILYDRKPDLVMEEFKEMDFGNFEMKNHDDLKDDPAYQRWINGGSSVVCPGGESRDIFENRVMIGFNKLSDLDAESAVVVCHGGVIVIIMEHLFPGKKNFYKWQPDFGRGYTLDIYHGSAALVSQL